MLTILSDIRVRGHKLELTLEGLGSFYVNDHLHTFSVNRIDFEDAEWLKKEITRRPALAGSKPKTIDSFLDVVQIEAPIDVAQSRCFTMQQLKNHLLSHPETEEEHRFAGRMFDYLISNPPPGKKPYTIDRIRNHLYAHPNVRRRHRYTIDDILIVLEKGWPINGEDGAMGGKADGKTVKDKTAKVRVPSPLPEEFCRGKYATYARRKVAPKGSIVEVDDSLVREISSGKKEISLENRITFKRMPTAKELLDQPMALVDIEIPLFRHKESEVSWAAMVLYAEREVKDRIIYTLYGFPDETTINGYRMVKCDDEQDLAAKVAADIKSSGTETFVAYNVPFDAIKLREAGKFQPGEDDEEPKKISTIPFFERIGIKAMNVRDLLAEAKKKFGYLPNRKLVLVAKHVLGDEVFAKSIDYDQQEDLEWVCKGKEPQREDVKEMLRDNSAEEIIGSYVSMDAEVMVKLIEDEAFNTSLEDIAFISQTLRIDPYLLLHDPKRIQIFQERKFFEKVGVYKDIVYPRFKSFIKYENRVKGKLTRTIEKRLSVKSQGLVRDVCQAYLPLGRVLRQDIGWFFPEVREIFNYIDQFKWDPQRAYSLTKFEDALSEWMWKDYASYLYEKDKLDKLIKKLDDQQGFDTLCSICFMYLMDNGLEKKLNRSAIAQKDLKPLLKSNEYMQAEGLSLREFQQMFRQWSRVRQRNRILFGAYEAGWETFAGRLENYCGEVEKFCQKNELEIAHVQGRHAYMTGNIANLYEEGCPLIPVDKMPTAYLAGGKIFYQKFGFYPGFKKTDKPTYNMSIFEMGVFVRFLEEVLNDDLPTAVASLWEGLGKLGGRDISRYHLIRQVKSTGIIKAYEKGEEIYFYDWGAEEDSRVKVLSGDEFIMERQIGEDRDFIMEPYLQGRSIVEKKRFLISPEEYEPDWEMYEEKISKRARGMMVPLLEKKLAKRFVNDALNVEQGNELEFYIENLDL